MFLIVELQSLVHNVQIIYDVPLTEFTFLDPVIHCLLHSETHFYLKFSFHYFEVLRRY